MIRYLLLFISLLGSCGIFTDFRTIRVSLPDETPPWFLDDTNQTGEVFYPGESGNIESRTVDWDSNFSIVVEKGSVPLINVDPQRIEQVLVNLVGNAIKFTPSGGSIKLSAKLKGKDIIVAVQDTGIGISKENQKHVFQKFFQVDSGLSRKYGGTGLGLSICKGIITLFHGEIWLESIDEKGCGFYSI